MNIKNKKNNFNRIAERRLKKIFREIESLANCSNKRYYSYSPKQIEDIRKTIIKKLDDQLNKFEHPYRNKKYY